MLQLGCFGGKRGEQGIILSGARVSQRKGPGQMVVEVQVDELELEEGRSWLEVRRRKERGSS